MYPSVRQLCNVGHKCNLVISGYEEDGRSYDLFFWVIENGNVVAARREKSWLLHDGRPYVNYYEINTMLPALTSGRSATASYFVHEYVHTGKLDFIMPLIDILFSHKYESACARISKRQPTQAHIHI